MNKTSKQTELPVFFDQSRWRWRIIKISVSAICIALLGFLAWIVPAMLSPVPVQPYKPSQAIASPSTGLPKRPAVQDVAAVMNSANTPVIGQGPLVRVLQVARDGGSIIGVDPFTHAPLTTIHQKDAQLIGDHPYVIEKYGNTNGKRLMLTFDDGPDPRFTPQLLDMLAREGVPSTFFVVGTNMVKHPEIAQRIVREGHIIGNHTATHANLEKASAVNATQEINQTQRIIRATINRDTSYFRPPYIDSTDQGLRNGIKGILQSQQLGYVIASYHFDTHDWGFKDGQSPPLPSLAGDADQVILLHDGGGDRTHTLAYVERLIKKAKAQGYQFATMQQLHPQARLFAPTQPALADTAALTIAKMALVWPQSLVWYLFGLSVLLLFLNLAINVILATLNRRRAKKRTYPDSFKPFVSVIIPAYNEGRVLGHTVRSVLKSKHKKLEVIIVDDGSTDNTAQIAKQLATKSRQVTLIRQENQGKSNALNRGIRQASGEIVICVDADTTFPPQTVRKLVRHFKNPAVGAVAGTVKVGNCANALARWQSLEYIVGTHVERNAQAYLDAIVVVPGACGAWRRSAVIEAGGYSQSTLAEDCDITLSVRKAGYQVVQDNEAISYTECPLTISDLAKQRFRWLFGNLQSFWKHRNMFFKRRYGWLGMLSLPNAALNIILPITFWPLLLALAIQNVITGNYLVIVLFLALTVGMHFITAVVGLIFAREAMGRHLLVVPMTRFVYLPLRTYLLYRSVTTALKGAYVGWNKLARSGPKPAAPQDGLRRSKPS